MLKGLIFFITFLLIFTFSFNLYSADENEAPEVASETDSETDVDIHAIPPILDPIYRHNKEKQFEFVAFGGSYLGNSLGQTWMVGGKLYYWFNNTIGVGANYSYSYLLTNRNTPFGSILTDPNVHALDGEIIVSNDAALRIGKSVIEMDFYATFGMGSMYLNGTWEPMGQIGGGVKFYMGVPWAAFRIDLGTYVHNTSQPGKDSIDFDMIMTGGFSFLFPWNRPPSGKEKITQDTGPVLTQDSF